MFSDKFELDNSKQYVLYGVGGDALKLSCIFAKDGINFIGYIDKRAKSLGKVNGKPVWNLDDLELLEKNSKNIVVIITIKNVFEHTSIAQTLAQHDLKQVVYKPLPVLQGSQNCDLIAISEAYDSFVVYLKPPMGKVLQKVRLGIEYIWKDSLKICEKNNKIFAWVPAELIYNYEHADAYENLSMPSMFPLLGLYRLFLGEQDEDKDAIEDFFVYASEWAKNSGLLVNDELKKSWLESRRAAFERMQQIVEYDFNFFVRNAPEVRYGNKGKFYLVKSGRNRVSFLIAKGFHFIPLQMNVQDYNLWLNNEKLEQSINRIQEEHIIKLNVGIPHPYLKNILTEFQDYQRLVCFPIMYYLIKNIYRNATEIQGTYKLLNETRVLNLKGKLRIGCCLNDNGAMSRYIDTNDIDVFRVENNNNSLLTKLLDELFGQKILEIKKETLSEQKLDIFIFDSSVGVNEVKELAQSRNIWLIRLGQQDTTFWNILSESRKCEFVKVVSTFLLKDGMNNVSIYCMRKCDE